MKKTFTNAFQLIHNSRSLVFQFFKIARWRLHLCPMLDEFSKIKWLSAAPRQRGTEPLLHWTHNQAVPSLAPAGCEVLSLSKPYCVVTHFNEYPGHCCGGNNHKWNILATWWCQSAPDHHTEENQSHCEQHIYRPKTWVRPSSYRSVSVKGIKWMVEVKR